MWDMFWFECLCFIIKTYFPLVVIQKASLTLHIVISWESILSEIKIKKTAGPLVSLSAIKGPNQGCEDPYLYTPPHSLPVIFIRDSITIQTYILLLWTYLPTMICPRNMADQFLGKTLSRRKFWARISENILLARFLPMAAISSSMSRTYHHPRYLDQNLHVNTSSAACQGRGNPWKLDQALELVPCISMREGVINRIFKT